MELRRTSWLAGKWTAAAAAMSLACGTGLQAQNAQPARKAPQENQRREIQQPRRTFQQEGEQSQRQQDEHHGLGLLVAPSPTTGVLVVDADPDGPAAVAGIQTGDYLMALDGDKITSPKQFERLKDAEADKRIVELTVWSNGKERTVKVDMTKRGQNPEEMADKAWLGVSLQRPAGDPHSDQGEANANEDADTKNADTKNADTKNAGEKVASGDKVGSKGAAITGTYPSGPAARAGLQAGDVITMVGDEKIATANDVIQAVDKLEPNKDVQVTVLRGEEEHAFNVLLGSRDEFVGPQWRYQQGFRGNMQDHNQFAGQYGQAGAEDQDEDFPEHSMMLEQQRRAAEQNQRIERMLIELRAEVESLRDQLQGKAPAAAQPQPRQ